MSNRSNIPSSSRQHTRTHSHPHSHNSTIVPSVPLQRTTSRPGSTSRPGTPSRGDIPSRKSATNLRKPTSPSSADPHSDLPLMTDQPATPTPQRKARKPRRGAKPSQQRHAPVGDDTLVANEDDSLGNEQEHEPSSEDEETLFDLLGVTSPAKEVPPQRGMLSLAKEDMDLALGRQKKGRKGKQDRLVDNEHESGHGGIAKQPRGGRDGSPAPARRGGRGPRQQAGQEVPSEVEVNQAKTGRRGKKASKTSPTQDIDIPESAHLQQNSSNGLPTKPSGLSATRPKGSKHAQTEDPIEQSTLAVDFPADSSFDISGLSKSLPSGGLAQIPKPKNAAGKVKKAGKKGVDSGDESAVWDMPEVIGGQELTWQQKLQAPNESTPRRNAKPGPSDRKSKSSKSTTSNIPTGQIPVPTHSPAVPSPLHPRPAQSRRLSLDGIPTASAPVTRAISAFDSYIPFHTGFNVHRAPQTPAKSVASANGNLIGKQQNGSLPIVGSGEFPRLHGAGQEGLERKASLGHGSGMGMKYAGPTFHNSPHAATLSKPDLEDF